MSDFFKALRAKQSFRSQPFRDLRKFGFPQVSFDHSAESPHCVLSPPAGSAESKNL
jgi:hypothetical protein